MKKITSLLVLGLALVLSCTKQGPTTVNRIEDMYTAPADAVVLNKVDDVETTWSVDRRYFDLTLSGNGSTLTTTLIGYDYFLAPGQYVFSPAVTSNIGNAVVEATKVNGTSLGLEGYILVNKKGSNYQITAVAGGKTYFFSGDINFEPDPDPLELTEVITAQKNAGIVTMQLASSGISKTTTQYWEEIWEGEGYCLALDLYSADGYLADGVYHPCAEGGVVNAGEFGIGWDNPDWGEYGLNWGTCLFEVGDGKATALKKITDGLITVTSREEKVDDKDVVIWTIFWGVDYPTEILFEGAIPALTKPKKPVGPVVPDYLFTEEITPGDVEKHAITITDKDKNIVAYLELLMASGETDYEGAYPSTSYASQPGQMCDGYDGGSYGEYTWPAGGSYYVLDGQEKRLYAGTATVTVTKIAEGAYNFACEFFDYNAAGPNYVPSGDDYDGVILTKFANITDYTGWGMKMIALEFCTDGLTPTPGFFGATYTGSGNYLKLEIYAESAAGPAPGTYVPNTVGTDDVAEGQFKAGYDPEGAKDYGTNWFTVTDSVVESSAHITDGTITVSKEGDTYTIIVESTAIKCKYVGPLQ